MGSVHRKVDSVSGSESMTVHGDVDAEEHEVEAAAAGFVGFGEGDVAEEGFEGGVEGLEFASLEAVPCMLDTGRGSRGGLVGVRLGGRHGAWYMLNLVVLD